MYNNLKAMERDIEAILFASGEAVEVARLAGAVECDIETLEILIQRICQRYRQNESPIDIVQLDGAYQMCTKPQYGPVIRAALELKRAAALSQAALEVLAIVAYNQPVTRALVEQVRGVDCSSLIRSLTEKRLIEEAGRMNIPGKPIVYKTTANFLRCFGIAGISELPELPVPQGSPGGYEPSPEQLNEDKSDQPLGSIDAVTVITHAES